VTYHLHITAPAEREIDRLSPPIARRVRLRIEELISDPFSSRHSKPLIGEAGLRSSRVGDWRVLFEVRPSDDASIQGVVVILRVGPRGRVYRRL
jgi:mRNA interferase RelE/StbE